MKIMMRVVVARLARCPVRAGRGERGYDQTSRSESSLSCAKKHKERRRGVRVVKRRESAMAQEGGWRF
jgi:hypothetical protein